MGREIPVEVSARHIHLCQNDLESLFGKNYQLKKIKDLTQPGDFAAEETLEISNNNKKITKVRIVGPIREETQVELSMTDFLDLRIKPIIRISGDIRGTPGVDLIGPKGGIKLKEGVIIAKRHIHCNRKEANELGLKDKDLASVKINGERGLVFDNIEIRVKENYQLAVHLDTDEGNAAGIDKKTKGFIA